MSGSQSLRRSIRAIALLVPAVLLAASAHVGAETPEGSILHEPIPSDPGEDINFSATTIEGDLPAAIQTPSGTVIAPDPQRRPSDKHVYSGATTDDSPDSTYEPDRDTRRPNIENYDDPFSPATAPFKRLRAYDWVEADYSLHVKERGLKTVPVGGSVGSGDEAFYGDLSVDLVADQPVRIPTVGPGARLLRMHVNPEVPVEVVRDGADNWFVRGKTRQRVRIVIELAIPRATFGSDFADVDWSALGKPGADLHDASVREVAQAIGVSRAMRPREVVKKMVAYYRAFSPSDQPPSGKRDIYLDLALSQKGVCRHRAFAFLVTALGLGVPTRMVVNEAHAWVEVFDSVLWHRVDLGGAALNMDHEPESDRPPYVPPPDPYAWPEGRDSGQDLADRNRQDAANGGGRNGASADGGVPGDAGGASGDGGPPGPPSPLGSADPVQSGAPPSEVIVTAIDSDVRRSVPLHLQGKVLSSGAPCPHLRIDVVIAGASVSNGATIGSLSTNDVGVFDGAVVIPKDFPLGDYDLVLQTPGDARCGPGRSK